MARRIVKNRFISRLFHGGQPPWLDEALAPEIRAAAKERRREHGGL
jgi:hypothetical protein